ncbi:MAG TPA: hypothetical protein VIY30_00200, partial [Burkholderiaceae bacterium]
GDKIYAQLAPELANVRAALAWAHSGEGDPVICVALAAKSKWLWDALNLVCEGRAHLLAWTASSSMAGSDILHGRLAGDGCRCLVGHGGSS